MFCGKDEMKMLQIKQMSYTKKFSTNHWRSSTAADAFGRTVASTLRPEFSLFRLAAA